ncbi:other/FunK1 protein kinase [Pholiota molesta]|nr:other/FunK1 protein kinase [Pholiota molesta]
MAEEEVRGNQATTAGGLESPPQNNIRTTARTRLHKEIAAEMEGEFIITDVQNFIKSYMPFEPTGVDVDAVVNSPSGKETITRDADQCLRFTELMDSDVGTEKVYFQPLQTIADRINSAEVNGRTRNKFSFQLCPESFIASNIPGQNNMIDACITLDDTEATILTTAGIAVVFEYTMNSNKSFENNMRAISANTQIMNDDARRMFTFGVTIVKDEVTLWYHSRSHSAVSEPFSFVQDPRLLIKVLMSFLFATEEELGCDSMVIREPGGTYIFKVPVDGKPDRFFRTEKSLSEYRSCNITGRMARVWQVGEYSSVEDTGKAKASFVLKDVWLEALASTEKEIQDSIFKDIEKFFQSSQDTDPMSMFDDATFETLKALVQNKEYKEYFLKISADYAGKTSKPVAPESKRKIGLFQSSASTPHGTPPCDFTSKRQYRVVFHEICRTVGELETLGEVVDVLQETVVALQLMYCAGWVHRDISSGNILAHRKDSGKWQAKLSDFEYARRYPPPPDYVLLTRKRLPKGTPYFMPHEILSLSTLYVIEQDEAEVEAHPFTVDQVLEMEASLTLVEHDPETTVTQSAPEQVIIYNFQHDLESVWWILLWTLTSRVPYEPSTDFAKKVFQNRTTMWMERKNCIMYDISRPLIACLEPSLRPFAAPLENARNTMFKYYVVRAKEKKLFDLEWYRKIHQYFAIFFRAVNKGSGPSNWRAMRLSTNKPQPSALASQRPQPGRNKRPRMNADYEPSESEESETGSEWVDSEDEKEKEEKKKGPMSKKPRTADVETSPQ